MAYVEMIIDSIRLATYKDEWVILLKEKDGHRCLPVYVDKPTADVVETILEDKEWDLIVDSELEKALATGDEVVLVIDGIDKGIFNAECILGWQGNQCGVRCSIGKVLAVCVKARGRILAEENVLEEAGIAGGA